MIKEIVGVGGPFQFPVNSFRGDGKKEVCCACEGTGMVALGGDYGVMPCFCEQGSLVEKIVKNPVSGVFASFEIRRRLSVALTG